MGKAAWFLHPCSDVLNRFKMCGLTNSLPEHPFLTVYITGYGSMNTVKPQSAVKEENSTGGCDKCTIFSSFTAKLPLVIKRMTEDQGQGQVHVYKRFEQVIKVLDIYKTFRKSIILAKGTGNINRC